MISALIALFPLSWPEPLRKAAAWASVAIAAIALIISAKAIYDASVVSDHETERTIESIDARDDAADARATDTITNAEADRERNHAIDEASDSPPSDADRRLNCQRLRDIGRVPAGC